MGACLHTSEYVEVTGEEQSGISHGNVHSRVHAYSFTQLRHPIPSLAGGGNQEKKKSA